MFCPKPGKPKRNGYINNTKNTYYDLDNKVKISLKKGNKKIMSNILPECKKMQRINEKGEIDLKVYAKGVVNKYKKEILEARRKLGYGSKQLIFDDEPINIGYNKNSIENYGRIIQDMFFGMGIKESIIFFTNHPKINSYEEALNTYMNEHRLDILKPHRSKYYQN